jgi:spermidine synthase
MLIVALLSISLISLELAWTRIFSAEFFYTFAFLVLSLAVLGLGLGALALHLFPAADQRKNLPAFLALCALTTLAGPPLVFTLGTDFSTIFHSWSMIGKFVLTILILSGAYFFGGMALALLFKQEHWRIDRLYMADLVGAGLGVVFVIPLMNELGTPTATFYCASPVILATLLTARRWWKLVPVMLAIGMGVLGARAPTLLEVEREERGPVIYKHWDAVSKIKIFKYEDDVARGMVIDNVANSPIYHFDGNWDRPDSLKFEFGIDVSYLIEQFDSCTFLSLGAGGGTDVLQALQAGASEVHAVEVIPHVNELMISGELADYTGRTYRDPRVIVATEDARAYVRRHPDTFDIIYSLSSNTFAALTSGAFAMAENYLFTTEAFQDYWISLSDDGFMMMEHQFYMPRLVSELIEALTSLGVEDVRSHFAIYKLPSMRREMMLLSKRPLTDELRNHAFGELTPEIEEHIHLLYPAPESRQDNLINQIVLNGWRAASDSTTFDLSPCGDDRPFTAQLGLWKNFSRDKLEKVSPMAEMRGFPLSKILIVVILLVVAAIILPLNLLPYLVSGEKLRTVPWLYFFSIGIAFMSVEVILIQKYALFVGHLTYSLAAVLLTLLIFSGLGSRFATRVASGAAFIAIVGWLLLDVFVFERITSALGHLTMGPRILLTSLLIAPLGFFMGMPFPKGGLRVGALVDWGFAVNGAASVVGATLIILVAFTHGYGIALLLGALVYLVALALYSWKRAW